MSDLKKTMAFILLPAALFLAAPAAFGLNTLADYTSYPVNLTQSVPPNIMIILDNSGSMNQCAYGSWPGDYGTVTDEPYACGDINTQVSSNSDDGEERASDGYSYDNSPDLDFNYEPDAYYTGSYVGVRFRDISIPPGATITQAYVQFTARSSDSSAVTVRVYAQDAANPGEFPNGSTNHDLTTRPRTTALVDWSIPNWTAGDTGSDYRTPDLSALVQEVVDRGDWLSGNPLVFLFDPVTGGTARRRAYTRDESSSRAATLFISFEAECPKYYGYFDPDAKYTYSSNKFVRDASGPWDGNWLNWLAMRRIDVARKVLMGGLATSRTGGGNSTLIGETPEQASRVYYRWYNGPDVSPYSGNYLYEVRNGYIKVYNSSGNYQATYQIKVDKDENYEPQDFYEGNLAGVLQRVGDKAFWGNTWFYAGTGNNNSGGFIHTPIGGNLTSLITGLQNRGADTWTPLAETFYVVMQYFKQEDVASGLDYSNSCVGPFNDQNDPYSRDSQVVDCAKSFVLLFTDGASTMDSKIPAAYKDYDNDGSDNTACNESTGANCDYPDSGTDYLDDLALYARTVDLRDGIDGAQNLILYPIYAFGDDPNARALLMDAARNGGFEDVNGNNRPDLAEEWDKNGDGVPDTYFEAKDGYELERRLMDAITDILKRASSGTAVSVLATSSEGEGTLVQAYFKPTVSTATTDVNWVGYLHALWVDDQGRLREDARPQGSAPGLVLTEDNIVEFFFDEINGQASFKRFALDAEGDKAFIDTNGNGIKDDGEDWDYTEHPIEDVRPIWEAGDMLAQRAWDDRVVYTFVDASGDGVVDVGEFKRFNVANATSIQPALGIGGETHLGASDADRAKNLIRFTLGNGQSGAWDGAVDVRYRTIDGNVWKMGDIVHSTPVTLGRPLDNYGLIYADQSYQAYYDTYKNREMVVYVGGNDGMLHAYLMGRFNTGDNSATTTQIEKSYLTKDAGTIEGYGDELWAFVPQALLPHLKWLSMEEYTHVYYVDLKPRVVDVKIFTPDATHVNGWGTVLIGGLNLGGKEISASGRTYYSSYFAIDITDPHNPNLLWERSFSNDGLTTVYPTVARVADSWFGILGTGPTSYVGESSQKAHIYVVDMEDGNLRRDYEIAERYSFMASPITVDVGLNYNVDVGYIGTTYSASSTWKGKMYRFLVPILDDSDPDPRNWVYDADPVHWDFSVMFEADRPITSAAAASVDAYNNFWVFFGTGRYFSTADKSDTSNEYFYGVKDPYFNPLMYYVNTPEAGKDSAMGHVLDSGDLEDATDTEVFTDYTVANGPENEWNALLEYMTQKDGWLVELTGGERVLTEPKVLGGIVLAPTFEPNAAVCGFGGTSNLLGLYFETGTAYVEEIFIPGTTQVTIGGQTKTRVESKISLGIGMGSSVGLHVGQEEGAQGYIQQSTGVVQSLNLSPAFSVKSGLIWWRER